VKLITFAETGKNALSKKPVLNFFQKMETVMEQSQVLKNTDQINFFHYRKSNYEGYVCQSM